MAIASLTSAVAKVVTNAALMRLTCSGGSPTCPADQVISAERMNAIVKRTQDGGAEIVALLKTGSAYYAPAASTADMVEAILKNTKATLPVCAYLSGEYGLNDICIGVPAKLGKNGIEKIVEIKLTKDEMVALHRSAEAIRENFPKIGL